MFESILNPEKDEDGVPNNSEAKAFRKDHWTIDKAMDQGQVTADPVDEEQENFLETQNIIPPREDI